MFGANRNVRPTSRFDFENFKIFCIRPIFIEIMKSLFFLSHLISANNARLVNEIYKAEQKIVYGTGTSPPVAIEVNRGQNLYFRLGCKFALQGL